MLGDMPDPLSLPTWRIHEYMQRCQAALDVRRAIWLHNRVGVVNEVSGEFVAYSDAVSRGLTTAEVASRFQREANEKC